MPELPEVEGFRVFAERHLVGRTVVRARALDDWMLKGVTPAALARRLTGRPLVAAERRGKLLIVFAGPRPGEPDAPALALHFGMTGRPLVAEAGSRPGPYDRLLLDLDDRTQFRYSNVRRLGSIRLLTRTQLADALWSLGPDPLEAPLAWFREALGTRRAPIKAVLLDQSFVAGIGNMYADEALFAAGVDPRRQAFTLAPDEARRLHAWMRRILRKAVEANTTQLMAPPRLRVPRERDEPCTRCGRPVRMETIGGRSTYFCPACQR